MTASFVCGPLRHVDTHFCQSLKIGLRGNGDATQPDGGWNPVLLLEKVGHIERRSSELAPIGGEGVTQESNPAGGTVGTARDTNPIPLLVFIGSGQAIIEQSEDLGGRQTEFSPLLEGHILADRAGDFYDVLDGKSSPPGFVPVNLSCLRCGDELNLRKAFHELDVIFKHLEGYSALFARLGGRQRPLLPRRICALAEI